VELTMTTTTRTVTLTLAQGFFTATCEGISGSPASTRREALGQLCDAFGKAGSWLNLGDAQVHGPEPVIGMAATYSIGSDSYACTVVNVLSKHRIEVCRDRELRPGIYAPAEGGKTMIASRRNDGRWREIGTSRAGSFTLGERETHLCREF
jgi:hypothetical protein